MQVNCHIFTLCIFHQKGKKWHSFLAAGFFLAGVSGLSLVFPALRQLCGAVLDTPPEYHRRKPGVSGRPEYPALVTGISGLLNCHRQKLRPGAESPPAPEFPVPGPESPALPRANNVWCGTGALSGGTPEGDRSFRPASESPAHSGRSLRPK